MSGDKPRNDFPGQAPKAVVSRLSLYLRETQHLLSAGQNTTSSTHLGSLLGVTDAQVRKDLAYFGQFGHPGIGYKCDELARSIREILYTNRNWNLALLGLGNLGRALLGYKGFGRQGFKIVAGFEIDPKKVGTTIDGVPIYGMGDLRRIAQEQSIRLAVIAVPAGSAQTVADAVVAAGIEGVLNFAPVTLNLPRSIEIVEVDLAIELEQLSFAVSRRTRDSDDEEANSPNPEVPRQTG